MAHRTSHPAAVLVMMAAGLCAGCGDQAATPGPCGTVLSGAQCAVVSSQLGTISQLVGGAAVPLPPPPDPTNIAGQSNPIEAAGAVLGQLLFFDPCLSQDQATSCASCHDRGAGFIDSRVDARGHRVQASPSSAATPLGQAPAKYTFRNSPTLYNVAYGNVIPPFDMNRGAGVTWGPWDGRYDSLWSLTAEVFEFGNTNRIDRGYIAYRIFLPGPEHDAYVNIFGNLPMPPWILPHHGTSASALSAAYACWTWNGAGADPCSPAMTSYGAADRATVDTIFYNAGKALSAYLRQLRSGASAYDRWLLDPNAYPLSDSAQRGLGLFIGKAECVLCHSGPNFTDERFHNLGVPTTDPALHTAGSDVQQQATPQPVPNPLCQVGAQPSPACPDVGHYGWQNKISGQCIDPTNCQKSNTASCVSSFSDAADKPSQCLPLSSYDPCSASADPDGCLSTLLCGTAPDASGCADAYTACTMAADPSNKSACLHSLALSRGTDLPCPAYDAGSCVQVSGGSCTLVSTTAMGQTTTRCIAQPPSADTGAFKTATLRNVGRTWPYMHNGSLSDYSAQDQGLFHPGDPDYQDELATPHLLAVLGFYDQGGGTPAVGTKDPLLRELHLTSGEKQDLVQFLLSLTDESVGQGGLGTSPWPAPVTCPN